MRPVFNRTRLIPLMVAMAAMSPTHAALAVTADGNTGDRRHKDTGRLSAKEGRRGSSPRSWWGGGVVEPAFDNIKSKRRHLRNLELKSRMKSSYVAYVQRGNVQRLQRIYV